LKPAQANSSKDPISKKKSQKRAGGVAQDVGPEFKLQYFKKKKKAMPTLPQEWMDSHGLSWAH
jgi:hypothetical protein